MSTFGAASRLRLLWALIEGERSVEELTKQTGLAQSAVSQQLRVLREARLVKVRRGEPPDRPKRDRIAPPAHLSSQLS